MINNVQQVVDIIIIATFKRIVCDTLVRNCFQCEGGYETNKKFEYV